VGTVHWSGKLNLLSIATATAIGIVLLFGASWRWYVAVPVALATYIALPVAVGIVLGSIRPSERASERGQTSSPRPSSRDGDRVRRETLLCRMINARRRVDRRLSGRPAADDWPMFQLKQTIEAAILDLIEQHFWLRDGGLSENEAWARIEALRTGAAGIRDAARWTTRSYIAHVLATADPAYVDLGEGLLDEALGMACAWSDQAVRLAKTASFPPIDWLQTQVPLLVVEQARRAAASDDGSSQIGAEPDDEIFDELLGLSRNRDWRRISGWIAPSDEVWIFSSPADHWRDGGGRRGIALIRHGRAIGHIVTLIPTGSNSDSFGIPLRAEQ
jgi:hypothetical protein